MLRRTTLIALLVAPLACGESSTSAPSTGDDAASVADTVSPGDVPENDTAASPDVALDAVGPVLPPRRCRPGAAWTPGTAAFTDVTAESGLAGLGVNGMRLSAADLDGDGLPEVVIRAHAPGKRDDFGPDGARYTWVLKNQGDLTFTDVTEASGLTATRSGGQGRTTQIVVFADVDNDGDLDALAGVNSGDPATDNGDRTEVLLNNGDLTFTLADPSGLQHDGAPSAITSATFVDADLDGNVDLWVGYDVLGQDVQQDRLYLGDGEGGFTDATLTAGLSTPPWTTIAVVNSGAVHRRSWGTTACDVNGDGWPDLLSSSYSRFFNGLWLSKGDGTFRDHAILSGVASDARTDWTTNLNAQCYCQLNPSAEGCAQAPAPPDYFPCQPGQALRWNHDFDREPFRLGGNTFSTLCGDLDNDGDLDLMHLEIVHWDVGDTSDPSEILYNQGGDSPAFTRPGPEATGLVRDWNRIDWNAGDINGALLDFDNDGRLDVYIASSDYPGTRGFLFHQRADGTFTEVPPAEGIDHPRSLGVAAVDFDGDGDLDLVSGHGRSRCSGDPTCYPSQEVHLFRNDLGHQGNWLQVRLAGQGANRAAIGARVEVTAGGVTQIREIDGGHGHYGQHNGLVAHFGLGEACDVERVVVRWPDEARTVDIFEDVRANYRLQIIQGGGISYDTEE